MAKYRFIDHNQARAVNVHVDPHVRVRDLLPQVIPHMKMPLMDNRGIEIIYLLSYQQRFLSQDETLASAGIMDGDTVDVIPRSIDLGATNRHAREWDDYAALNELQEDNPEVFDLDILGFAYDEAPLGYRLTFKGIAGPVIRKNTNNEPTRQPLLGTGGHPILSERFVVDIFIMERYPFVEPHFFYVDPILFHPNVNAFSRKACLYEHWRAIHTLSDAVERFIHQISYLAQPAPGPHVLNEEAMQWLTTYRSAHSSRLPFKNKAGQGPPVLQKPPLTSSGPIAVIEADDLHITIKK